MINRLLFFGNSLKFYAENPKIVLTVRSLFSNCLIDELGRKTLTRRCGQTVQIVGVGKPRRQY